jgi:hemerythrin
MALVKWRDEYCTGISDIDYDHEQMIELINSLYILLENQSEKQRILNCLGDIYANIATHFMLEELTMKKNDYDQYELHKSDHNQLLDDIYDIKENFEKSDRLNNQDLEDKMDNWFIIHFKTHDARLHKLGQEMASKADNISIFSSLFKKAKKSFLSKQ